MKIKKSSAVKAGSCMKHNCKCDHKKEAMNHIQAAMDALSLVENDPVCEDSIANLSVVFLDLCPCDETGTLDEVTFPESVDDVPTLTNEGMVSE